MGEKNGICSKRARNGEENFSTFILDKILIV